MRMTWALAGMVLASCTTAPGSPCNYAARPVRCEADGSIDYQDGKLYLSSPVCSKVKIRLEGCARDHDWVEKWIENTSGYEWTGQSTWSCGVEIVKGSCREYPETVR